MTKGKIVLVPFPFDDLSATKVRPAVCLTNPIGPYNHIILAFITSKIPSDLLETDIVLDTTHPDFAASGLHTASTIRLDRLMTVRKSVVQRELGQLSSDTQVQIADKLCKLLTE
ncbi:type II toxin-antitoxin system PemK/MazF family toxin [Planktothrix sp. FACHB-1355]|uniref:Type II toxin-antitoxin system PemK/MazF family toxin n=1 Tax=Aerosakkonema funiforme FACHB-1375 TaxID=2949571 RepID=A0A926VHV0_9CYAN|nr:MULTISPECIES: type II toxin-antitoxin system PemK/MazF family toxin [Oscillatoriales]MBD2184067.1 type II toxin-antitoxin system PemK/MazF family toxin [Aerosakkonema funiforme FACHB-1375]MBD3560614.1 type II toxin-antitoxin system PemK/MazF family toxin [Planktothrix sp. FACHB-1355]